MPLVDCSSDSEMSLHICHSGLDPESSVFELDSLRVNDGLGIYAKEY